MKEYGRSFTAESINAILAGAKTRTRRVIHPQPVSQGMETFGEAWKWNEGGKGWFSGVTEEQIKHPRYGLVKQLAEISAGPGDRLWVKETWGVADGQGKLVDPCITYKAGGQRPLLTLNRMEWRIAGSGYGVGSEKLLKVKEGWQTPRFMPRWASRITLEVTGIRVQRVQDISEPDAIAEGVAASAMTAEDIADIQISDASPFVKALARRLGPGAFTAKFAYQKIWDKINAKRGFGWDANPWVCATTFRLVKPA